MEVLKDSVTIERILTKGVEQILPSSDALRDLLLSGKKINVYQGFDPTADTLHIGHSVGMRKLEDFRKLGHNVIFLIGDFTARIGDPSDKTSARVKLSKEQVEENMRRYVDQASHIIDIFNKDNPVKVLYNSQWLEPLNFADIIELASEFTVQQMLKRSMFQKRLEEDKPIYLNEFLYPLMQGYDSVMMDIDVEIGGNDQLFNMLAGRDLIRSRLNKEKIVLAGKLLSTADGTKMGKSEGNMIKLSDTPNDIYGKVMAFEDTQIVIGFEILTSYEMDKVEQIQKRLESGENPIDLKKELAYEVTKDIKGEDEATSAQRYFENVFQRKDTETEIPEREVNSKKIVDILVELDITESKGQARRLVEQGAVRVNEERITDWNTELTLNRSEVNTLKCGRHIYQIRSISD
jgi:tyrosyl-tRNA synthetase